MEGIIVRYINWSGLVVKQLSSKAEQDVTVKAVARSANDSTFGNFGSRVYYFFHWQYCKNWQSNVVLCDKYLHEEPDIILL